MFCADPIINSFRGSVDEHCRTCRSQRRRQRCTRRISDADSDSEGAKTGALSRVERNRVIQKEYLVRKRVRIISIIMMTPVIEQHYHTFMSRVGNFKAPRPGALLPALLPPFARC